MNGNKEAEEMNRMRVFSPCLVVYGTEYQAKVHLRMNQIWEPVMMNTEGTVVSLERHGVCIDIRQSDLEKIFAEVEERKIV